MGACTDLPAHDTIRAGVPGPSWRGLYQDAVVLRPVVHPLPKPRHFSPDDLRVRKKCGGALCGLAELTEAARGGHVALTERDALFQVLDALEVLDIPYMVVGSFASTFWGRPRTTYYVDPGGSSHRLARRSPNWPWLLAALYFYAPLFVIEDAVRKRGQFQPYSSTWIVLSRFTCGFGRDRPTMRHLLSGACWASCSTAKVWISSPEDVILSKLPMVSGRARATPAVPRCFRSL